MIGVPLSRLQELARARQTSIPINVSVKLVLDALRASIALRQGCRDQNLLVPEHTIFPDCVMVANFGEALLSGIGVTEELCRCLSIREDPDLIDILDPATPINANGADQSFEVFTAGALLWKLLLIRSLFENYGNQQTLDLVLHSKVLLAEYDERMNLCVPKPIADIIRRATQGNLGLRYPSLQEMSGAIEALPSQLLADDGQVRAWLENIAGDYLSDVQHSSGVRRVPLGLRSARAPHTSTERPSYIPTPLPGFHAPVAPNVAPFWPERSEGAHDAQPASTSDREIRPAGVRTTGSERPREVKRPFRNAYILGALLGLLLSLCILYMGGRIGSRPAAANATTAPMPTKFETLPVAPAVSTHDSNTEDLSDIASANHSGQPQTTIQEGSNSASMVSDPSNARRSNRAGPQARAGAATHSRTSNSGSSNRWGI